MKNKKNKMITYHYKFRFKNGVEKNFNLRVDEKTLDLQTRKRKSSPKWTNLNYFQCPHCPLDAKYNRYCPVAVNLVGLINFFKKSVSHEKVEVSIKTEAREYKKNTTLQRGLSSLMGVYMVTSGCPVMGKLKPMVRFHLPFSTLEETSYRVISMYLFAQYFFYRRGKKPDWKLKNLVTIYDDIQIVNLNFSRRFASLEISDAILNAIVVLNNFADAVKFSINKSMLEEIELLFDTYFN